MLCQCCSVLSTSSAFLGVQRVDATAVKVVIEQAAREGPCPACGVFSGTAR
jgi:hypothetical protein